jgi:hypothetical protein
MLLQACPGPPLENISPLDLLKWFDFAIKLDGPTPLIKLIQEVFLKSHGLVMVLPWQEQA